MNEKYYNYIGKHGKIIRHGVCLPWIIVIKVPSNFEILELIADKQNRKYIYSIYIYNNNHHGKYVMDADTIIRIINDKSWIIDNINIYKHTKSAQK